MTPDNDRLVALTDGVDVHCGALRSAGERMFMLLAHQACPLCGQDDPRHPERKGCTSCRQRAKAMDAWDNVLVATRLDLRMNEGERA